MCLDRFSSFKFKESTIVLKGEPIGAHHLDVPHLVNEEDTVWYDAILLEFVRRLLVVGQIGTICDHLEVLLLPHSDEFLCLL